MSDERSIDDHTESTSVDDIEVDDSITRRPRLQSLKDTRETKKRKIEKNDVMEVEDLISVWVRIGDGNIHKVFVSESADVSDLKTELMKVERKEERFCFGHYSYGGGLVKISEIAYQGNTLPLNVVLSDITVTYEEPLVVKLDLISVQCVVLTDQGESQPVTMYMRNGNTIEQLKDALYESKKIHHLMYAEGEPVPIQGLRWDPSFEIVETLPDTYSGCKYDDGFLDSLAPLTELGVNGVNTNSRKGGSPVVVHVKSTTGSISLSQYTLVDSPISNMWEQVLGKTLEIRDVDPIEDSDDEEVLVKGIEQMISLGDSATWITEDPQIEKVQCLYIRECNLEIWDIIQHYYEDKPLKSGVVIIGNPGIGKSWFLNYCLVRFAEMGKTIVFESRVSSVYYVFGNDGSVQLIEFEYLSRGDILRDIKALLNSGEDVVYLVDAGKDTGEPRFSGCKAFAVVASCPNRTHYKEFLKMIRGNKLYMPSWSKKEVKSLIRELELDDEECDRVVERYHIFGGVLRYIMIESFDTKDQLDRHASSIKYGDLIKCLDGLQFVNEISHKLFAYKISDDLDLIEKYSRGVTISYASKYVERLITTNLLASNLKSMSYTVDTLRDPFASSLRGNIFEVVSHKRLFGGGSFQVLSLGFESDVEQLNLPKLDVYYFEDLSEVQEIGYYIPKVPNFPVVDAFAILKLSEKQGRGGRIKAETKKIGLQMTISKKHPIKLKTKLAKDVMNLISDIYFVVPSDIAREYPEQKCKKGNKSVKDKTKQWSLSISLS